MQLDPDGNLVYDSEGQPLGKTLPLFEYTEQKIVSNSDYKIIFDQAIQDGKYKAPKLPWLVDPRDPDKFYRDNCVSTLPRIGEVGKKWLLARPSPFGPVDSVAKYFKFFYGRIARRKTFCKDVRGMNSEGQATAEVRAEKAEESPAVIDHCKSKNPYFSLYGASAWMAEVERTRKMRAIVNIRVLVAHMVHSGIEEYR